MVQNLSQKNHVNRRPVGDGELARTADIIEQLARRADIDVGLAKIFERGHGQPREQAEDRDDDEHLDQREPGLAADNFHNKQLKKHLLPARDVDFVRPEFAGKFGSMEIFPFTGGPADQTMTLP